MSRIVYYISSHGFGHATRSVEVINCLSPIHEVEAVTAAPSWLIEKSLRRPCFIRALHHDCGIIQPDSFQQDLHSTLDEWHRLLDAYPAMAQAEVERLLASDTRLIVGDISPFAVAVAKLARLPVIIVANFSWDWIFSIFVDREPRFAEIIQRIADLYRETDLLLRTPLHGDLSVFPHIEDIPIIARRSELSVEEARRRLGLKPSDKVVLASFGGFGFDGIEPETLAKYPDWIFLTLRETLVGPPNVRLLDPVATHHPDAVQAADIALAKLGYGIVTECIAHQTPMIHPPPTRFSRT